MALLALNIGISLVVAALLASYLWQQARIRAIARDVLRDVLHPRMGTSIHREVSARLAGWVYTNVAFTLKDPLFVPIPGLRWLGASPLAVARLGGCCSGKSRLLICLLRAVQQEAYQISMYHRTGVARHALVAASSSYHEAILDPLYGFQYVGANGASYGLRELRAGAPHGYAPLPSSEERGYPDSEYYDFAFGETRTAGWTQTRLHRAAYAILRSLTGGRIDTWPQPWWMEWPQLLLSVALIALCVWVNLLGLTLPLA